MNLLAGSDIQFHRHNRLDIALVKNHPLALVFLPASDIPVFVGQGRVDLGITGRDQVAEHETEKPPTDTTGVVEMLDLNFGRCKLQVQVPEHGLIMEPEQLVGKTVATSFVNLAQKYFRDLENGQREDRSSGDGERSLRTTIINLGGSVETACALGVADGILDLVESGETMRVAGLKPISTVMDSTAVLIKSKHASNPALVGLIAARIQGVISELSVLHVYSFLTSDSDAQKYVLCTYNIERPKLEAACKITPGKRAPTINALEEAGWVAVQTMVEKKKIAVVMDELTGVGACDILVIKIDNSRTK